MADELVAKIGWTETRIKSTESVNNRRFSRVRPPLIFQPFANREDGLIRLPSFVPNSEARHVFSPPDFLVPSTGVSGHRLHELSD